MAPPFQFGPPSSTGRPTVWDPNMGRGGEWVTLPDNKFPDYGLPPPSPEPPPGPAPIAPTPGEGIVRESFIRYDPETGEPLVTTDPETGQQHYTLRNTLMGGMVTDPRIGIPGINDDLTAQILDLRYTTRERGFTGDFNQQREVLYHEGNQGQRGLVDQYGYQSAAGRVDDILNSPTADMPTGAIYTASMIDQDAPGSIQNVDDSRQYINTLPSVQQQTGASTDAQNVSERVAVEYEAREQFNAVSEQEAAAALINDQIQLITAQQEEVDDRSTVRGQLTRLSSEFEGGAVPPWAAGAMGAAQQIMAARGLGASSIAGDVITASAMNTMIPIAQADAGIFAEFQRLNLNNRQQAEIQNAANLLTTDLKDVDNKQQVAVFNTGNRVQGLFTDQSEVNAASRINAASVNQTQQYFAGLQQSVLSANAAQRTAISQFNAGQGNALEQFRATQDMQAQQYNAQNYTAISQANTQWARQVNTANTAALNAQNQLNATNILNRSNTSLNNQIQIMRDKADFTFNAGQNDSQRQTNLAVATLQAEAARLAGSSGSGGPSGGSFLGAAGGVLAKIFGNWAGTESGGGTISKWITKIPWFR